MVRFGLAKFLLTQRDRSGMWTCVWEVMGSPCSALWTDSFWSQFPYAISYLGPGHTEQANSVQSSSKSKNQSLHPPAQPQTPRMSSQVGAKRPGEEGRGQGTRKHRGCMWWLSIDCWPPALCGGALESPTGEWSDSALEKQKRVNTRPPLPGEGLFHPEALSIPSPQKPQVCRHKSSSWEGFTVHFRTL